MKEHLRRLVSGAPGDLARALLAREYLQARVLEFLQEAGVFLHWAFLGGTALRFLFEIPRFSEDLDFSLIKPSDDPAFGRALGEVERGFALEGYRVEVKSSGERAVASAWLAFPGLPLELGFSTRQSQTLSIRLEVDTNPPAGAVVATSLIRRHVTLNLCHYDRPSLLAGKLHAVLTRPWTKGRDLFDLAWYLADPSWPGPNFALLNAALAQTGWEGPPLDPSNWIPVLRSRLASLDWKQAREDVSPFLERPRDLALVSPESIDNLLSSRERRGKTSNK